MNSAAKNNTKKLPLKPQSDFKDGDISFQSVYRVRWLEKWGRFFTGTTADRERKDPTGREKHSIKLCIVQETGFKSL